jgi:type IV pilus assembly protein PilA
MRSRLRQQSGFTIVELIIVTCIIAVLASVAIKSYREYSLRARVSEVILAANTCKNAVAEGYPVRDYAPDPGGWGCEATGGVTHLAGAVQTSSNGAIRITVTNMDSVLNGRHVFLVPSRSDGLTPLTSSDLGNGVRSWMCGSDWLPLRNSLPSSCRQDMLTYASDDYN